MHNIPNAMKIAIAVAAGSRYLACAWKNVTLNLKKEAAKRAI
jgi:hypothetical protein